MVVREISGLPSRVLLGDYSKPCFESDSRTGILPVQWTEKRDPGGTGKMPVLLRRISNNFD
jgi:hypothetical protein